LAGQSVAESAVSTADGLVEPMVVVKVAHSAGQKVSDLALLLGMQKTYLGALTAVL
jgi:hypothetical protein